MRDPPRLQLALTPTPRLKLDDKAIRRYGFAIEVPKNIHLLDGHQGEGRAGVREDDLERGAQTRLLDRCGHFPRIEHVAAVNRLLGDFLRAGAGR